MKTNLKTLRTGTLKIVSSGYEDRYVMGHVYLVIECDGVKYHIEDDNDRVAAYARLAGWGGITNLTKKKIKHAVHEIVSCPVVMNASYINGNTSGTIATTSDRLSAGIYAATGYPALNERGISTYKPIAETLTKQEWMVVRSGLEQINKHHAEIGKPIVNFSIPEVA